MYIRVIFQRFLYISIHLGCVKLTGFNSDYFLVMDIVKLFSFVNIKTVTTYKKNAL